MNHLLLRPDAAIGELTSFLREGIRQAGYERAVLGLSGGIDSALSAALAARALGPESVFAILMPFRTSDPASLSDAREVIAKTGIHEILEEITPQIDAWLDRHPGADPIRRGNKMARERMTILYDWSKQLPALVVGTGNRTEGLLGYTTLWGDNVCALNPLGNLLKTHVRQLARALDLPARIIAKPPSADLWTGQTDEGEMGLTYEEVDPVLVALFDRGLDRDAAVAEGFAARVVDRALALHRASGFKRRLPPVAPLSPTAFAD
jgi:NAD+ synthase